MLQQLSQRLLHILLCVLTTVALLLSLPCYAYGTPSEEAASQNNPVVEITYNLQVQKNGLTQQGDLSSAMPLSDAGFSLYSDAACTKLTHAQQMTNSEGQTMFLGLHVGKTYYLRETQIPKGYNYEGEVLALKVKEDGIYVAQPEGEVKLSSLEADASCFMIGLTNNSVAISLPANDSAITPILIQAFGLAIMLVAVVALIRRMRQKR